MQKNIGYKNTDTEDRRIQNIQYGIQNTEYGLENIEKYRIELNIEYKIEYVQSRIQNIECKIQTKEQNREVYRLRNIEDSGIENVEINRRWNISE